MKKAQVNPFYSTIIGLILWFVFIPVIAGLFVELSNSGGGELGFFIWSVYLSPFVCIVLFNGSLLFNRNWARRNIWIILIINILFLSWVVNTYFAYKENDFGEIWFFQLLNMINKPS